MNKNSADYIALEKCYRLIRDRYENAIVPPTDFSDKETFDLINSPDIGYVFFPEGVGEKIKEEIKKYRPTTIDELATVLLFHREGDDLSVFSDAYKNSEAGKMLESAKICYLRAYLKTHYRTEFNQVYYLKGRIKK